jgi:hypothetical protein
LVERKLLRDGSEKVSNILSGLCGGLEEEEAGLASIGFGVGSRNCTLVWLLGDEI